MQKTIFVIITSFITLLLMVFVFFVVAMFLMFLLTEFLASGQTVGIEAFTYVSLSIVAGFLSSPLSLIPSYKLSMKLAEKLRERGWEIRHPRRLFALSLGLLVLPFLLLLFLGVFFSQS